MVDTGLRGGAGPELALDMEALKSNWRRMGADPERVAAVIKAEAYGLGLAPVARALSRMGCRVFYVAYAEEGVKLRALTGSGAEIFVLNGPDSYNRPALLSYRLTPVLNSLQQIGLWREAGGARAALHLDTGMNRLGVSPCDWSQAQALLPEPCLLMSHLACADTPSHEMNRRQLAQFREVAARFPKARKSLAASAGVALGSEYLFDEIRPGIGLYGGGPDVQGQPPAQVAQLSAPVLQIRRFEPGTSVGYGALYGLAGEARPRILACLGIGYADGVLSSGSDGGYVVIDGEKRPVLGRVSMDLTMVDVTGLKLEPGMRAEILGPNLTLNEQAEAVGMIPYELLTALGARTRRV